MLILIQGRILMKQFSLLILVILLFLPIGFAQKTELRIAWWGSQSRHDRTIQVIEMFEADHPDVDIIFEPSSWGDHWTKMAVQAAGDNLPDIMQQDYAFLQEWASRDLVVPLDDYVGTTIDTSTISEAVLAGGIVDGKLYGINLGNNSLTITLDVDAFEKAGIDLPSPDWTWTEFEEIAMKLHETLGVWAIGPGLYNDKMWKSLYLGQGEWSYSDDGATLGYQNDEIFVAYLKMIQRLIAAGAAPTRAEEIAEFFGQGIEALPIVSKRSAMDMFWSNQIVAVGNAAGENRTFKMWHLPRLEGGASQNYIKPSMFFSITKDSKNPELAVEFINFFTNSLEANDILLAERGVPIAGAVREHLAPKLTATQVEMFDFLSRVEVDSSPIRPPDPVGHSDIVYNVYDPIIIDQVFYGQISPERAVEVLRREASRILAKNQ